MKTSPKRWSLLPALTAGLCLTLPGHLTAQTFTTLRSFTSVSGSGGYEGTNSDGGGPSVAILSGNTVYGTTVAGGSSGNGTVFALNIDGTGFTILHSFSPSSTSSLGPWTNIDGQSMGVSTNRDGAIPYGGLILSGNILYGTAGWGGNSGSGTVFAVNTNGTGFTVLHNFTLLASPYWTNSDGAYPNAGLILSGDTLYGTAREGGRSDNGTVFKINLDGTGFTTLHSFTETSTNSPDFYTNSDGAIPNGGLILSSNILYGTTRVGSSSDNGTMFSLGIDGTGFTTLHSFRETSTNSLDFYTNGDGAIPYGGLILSGNILYGTAGWGGNSGNGTVFAVHTDGTEFTNLYSFSASPAVRPLTGLVLSGNTLYGTARTGFNGLFGVVFALNVDGTGFTILHGFTPAAPLPWSGLFSTPNTDGAHPSDGLILAGNTLVGATTAGGSSGYGTVFSIMLPPQLTLTPSGPNMILTWPTNYSGFTLQSTTNLGPSTVWTTNSPLPVIVNGQNTVTNPFSATQQFFRLGQ